MTKTALIVGTGSGISASFARLLAKDGYRVALVSRNPAKLTQLAAETKATTHSCDAVDPASVDHADTCLELACDLLLDAVDCCHHGEPCLDRPLRVVLVCPGIAEIDEYAVAQVLGDTISGGADGVEGRPADLVSRLVCCSADTSATPHRRSG